VLDDATWGAFQAGWQDGFGADADHLKTTADIDGCAAAGYTMFTIDPSEHVDNDANTAPLPRLSEKLGGIPWQALETTWEDTRARYRDGQSTWADRVSPRARRSGFGRR
jgi:hypothetical protein